MSDRFIDISITGDKELQKKLARLDFALQRTIVRQSARLAMKPVKDRAQSLVPVDSGQLKQSIKVMSKTRRGISRISVVTGTRPELGIDPDQKGYYPAALEFGYKALNGRFIAPKSFLRKALSDLQESVKNDLGQKINAKILRKVKK